MSHVLPVEECQAQKPRACAEINNKVVSLGLGGPSETVVIGEAAKAGWSGMVDSPQYLTHHSGCCLISPWF